jgi:phosphate transport system permease protein
MIEDYYDFPTGSDFGAVGQSPTRAAIVAANWRGWAQHTCCGCKSRREAEPVDIYTRRRIANGTVMSLSVAATAFGILWLILVLWTLLENGIAAITPALFSQMTPPPGSAGGLLNAIFGSVVMTLVATLVGTPTGILAGTFLAEYSRGSRFGEVVRFINDILLSAPSIIVGLFVYELMVVHMGHFSAWAGAMALAIIVIPVVVRTSEDMLNLVPNALREAAAALGSPKWKVIVMVSYRAAIQGMVTGVMLAVARIAGETAPLLFTALNNQFWSTDLNAPMANLPVVIFQFAMSPYADWQVLAWGGELLITVTVLFLNIGARILTSWSTFKQ